MQTRLRTLEKRVAALLLSTVSYIAAVLPAAAYMPGNGLRGSPHDFRDSRYAAAGEGGACNYCHAGHDDRVRGEAAAGPLASRSLLQASDTFDYLPVWNHELTANLRYRMYESGTGAPSRGSKASQAAGISLRPGGSSLLCLSCHDGTIAVNSYGNVFGAGAMIDSPYLIGAGNSLANHHPVGFDYDSVRAQDSEIRPADVAMLGAAGTVRMHLSGPGNSMLECSTCHSVHNSGNTGEYLLWRSDARSRLCLTCHDKGADPGAAVP